MNAVPAWVLLADSTGTSIVLPSVIAIFVALTAPLVLVYLTGRQHTKDKLMDYKRQDLVASRLEVATKAASAAAAAASETMIQVKDTVDVVHTLVNSDKTAAMQRELDDKCNALVMLKEIGRLHHLAGNTPAAENTAAIKATELKIKELKSELQERHRQGKLATAQIEASLSDEGSSVTVVADLPDPENKSEAEVKSEVKEKS